MFKSPLIKKIIMKAAKIGMQYIVIFFYLKRNPKGPKSIN